MLDTDTDDTNETESRNDRTRRHVLVGASTALAAAVAGCSGGGDGDGSDGSDGTPTDDGGGGSTPTATSTPTESGSDGSGDGTPTQESMGEVGENAIGEIELLGWTSEARMDIFSVTVTFANDGDRTIDAEAYTWWFVAYDEAGNELEFSVAPEGVVLGDPEVPAGDTGEIYIEARRDDPEAVASYELMLDCSGMYADGAYCPD